MEGSEKSSANNDHSSSGNGNDHSSGTSSGNGNDHSSSSSHDEEAQPPKVSIEPARVEVPAGGGVSTHLLHNESRKRLAFKIKTSDNQHYRLSQVYGFINGGESATIEVKRLEGPPSTHMMLVQLLEVTDEETNPQVPFKQGLPPVTELRVPMVAN